MTSAGLLGLAVGRGITKQTKEKIAKEGRGKFMDDPAVVKAFGYLNRTIGKVAFRKSPGRGRILMTNAWGDFYYLWSLERVGVVYDLKKMSGKDWYAWGSDIIVATQNEDGSWTESYAGVPDTCFALLFLKRVNVVKDLTSTLQKLESKINLDPEQARKIKEAEEEAERKQRAEAARAKTKREAVEQKRRGEEAKARAEREAALRKQRQEQARAEREKQAVAKLRLVKGLEEIALDARLKGQKAKAAKFYGKAKKEYKDLIDTYPGTDAAAQAKKSLAKLND
jgi:hypothetical protein